MIMQKKIINMVLNNIYGALKRQLIGKTLQSKSIREDKKEMEASK